MDLRFQTGRDSVLGCFAKEKNLRSMINKHFHKLSLNMLFQQSKIYRQFWRNLKEAEATAHFKQGFSWLLILPLAIKEEKYLMQHMKHIPQVTAFLSWIKLLQEMFSKGTKLISTFLLQKKKKSYQYDFKRMKVGRN